MPVGLQSFNTPKIRRILGLSIFLILAVLAVFLLPWKNTWQILRTANLNFILLAMVLSIPMQLLSASVYKLILGGQKANISYWRLLAINLAMNFYDIILPSTFVVSGLRWYRYSKQSQKPAQSFVSIAFYKVFNIALALILSLAFLSFSDTTSLQGHLWQLLLILVGIVVVMMVTPLCCRWILKKLPVPSPDLESKNILKKGWEYIYKIIQAFADFERLKFTTQILIIGFGIAGHLLMYASYLFIAKSVGVNLTYAQLGTLRAVLLLAVNLPFNFGIGINLRDVTLLAILSAMGIALDKAVAISVISFARVLFVGAIGGIVELVTLLFTKKNKPNNILEDAPTDL